MLILVFGIIIASALFPLYSDIFRSNDIYLQNIAAKLFVVLLERLSIGFGLVLLIILIHQVLVIHKLCGPLVNFGKIFNKISQGDLTQKIILRRRDFLQNEAHQVNEMLDSLTDSLSAIKKENTLLLSELEQLISKQAEKETIVNALKNVKRRAELSHNHLSKFIILET
jgi:methyl-accepting chemotaxis protein